MSSSFFLFFFFNDTATTEIYTLSLHDALPISAAQERPANPRHPDHRALRACARRLPRKGARCRMRRVRHRSEEHTSELQSQSNLVCRLLLEKKKKQKEYNNSTVISAAHLTQ